MVVSIPTTLNGNQSMPRSLHNNNIFDNYRPMSTTSIICQLTVSIVRDKIVVHMKRINCFLKCNMDLCPLETAWLTFYSPLPHQRLLQKVKDMRIIGNTVNWIKSSLSERIQRMLKIKDMGIIGSTVNWIKSSISERIQRMRVEQDFSLWPPVKSGGSEGSVIDLYHLLSSLKTRLMSLTVFDSVLQAMQKYFVSLGERMITEYCKMIQTNFPNGQNDGDYLSTWVNAKVCI